MRLPGDGASSSTDSVCEAPSCATATPTRLCARRELSADAEFWAAFDERHTLGRGCFGTVLLVQPRTASAMPALLAAKVVMMSDDTSDALQEAALLRSCSHPNIVTLHEVYASPSTVFMLMGAELGGDLHKRAEASPGGVLAEAEALGPVAGVLAALRHLHGRHGIVHRDVKASNVLLSADGRTAKLGDFGLAARLPAHGRLTSVCGTHDFLAPEMIRTGHGELPGYGASVDMWAVGLMLHALLLGDNPFERPTDIETLAAILAGDYAPPHDARVSEGARQLLGALLVPEPERRASADAPVVHAWAKAAPPTHPAPPHLHRRSRSGRLIERLWARAG